MARVKGGTTARAGRKKVLKEAKGYFGSKHRLYKTAKEQLLHSYVYAYKDRKRKKRDFRKLWITRINAGCRENEISYSKFINGLSKAGIIINRKMLSEMAINSPESFKEIVEISKNALEGKEYKPSKVELKVAKKETKATVKEETIEVEKEVEVKPVVKKTVTKSVAKKTTAKAVKAPVKKAVVKTTTKTSTPKKTTTKKTATKTSAKK
jgi:large subunit ribosomal protein L20